MSGALFVSILQHTNSKERASRAKRAGIDEPIDEHVLASQWVVPPGGGASARSSVAGPGKTRDILSAANIRQNLDSYNFKALVYFVLSSALADEAEPLQRGAPEDDDLLTQGQVVGFK